VLGAVRHALAHRGPCRHGGSCGRPTLESKLLSAVTGRDVDEEGLNRVANGSSIYRGQFWSGRGTGEGTSTSHPVAASLTRCG